MKGKNHNKNNHPDFVGIPQFCFFNFYFCILKLTIGRFEELSLVQSFEGVNDDGDVRVGRPAAHYDRYAGSLENLLFCCAGF